jgi:ribonuclease P protein component
VKIGRIVLATDFERVLRTAPRTRSAHFVLHHLDAPPGKPAAELSTGVNPDALQPVDDSAPRAWLGTVIPKRHARRAVTRNLLKRAVRESAGAHAATLGRGLWVVRLRTAIEPGRYLSAAPAALRRAVRSELDGLFERGTASSS